MVYIGNTMYTLRIFIEENIEKIELRMKPVEDTHSHTHTY